jgi:D-threo-aldose 1-dehydrogenase
MGAFRAVDQVEIGKTGVRVSRLGLGGVALSGAPPATDPHQATAEADGVALIKKSLALGLNYLDTAPMYGVGGSESRYGKALSGVPRDSYVISTKVGRVLDPAEPGSAQMKWSFDFSAHGVRRSRTRWRGSGSTGWTSCSFTIPTTTMRQPSRRPSQSCSS